MATTQVTTTPLMRYLAAAFYTCVPGDGWVQASLTIIASSIAYLAYSDSPEPTLVLDGPSPSAFEVSYVRHSHC